MTPLPITARLGVKDSHPDRMLKLNGTPVAVSLSRYGCTSLQLDHVLSKTEGRKAYARSAFGPQTAKGSDFLTKRRNVTFCAEKVQGGSWHSTLLWFATVAATCTSCNLRYMRVHTRASTHTHACTLRIYYLQKMQRMWCTREKALVLGKFFRD